MSPDRKEELRAHFEPEHPVCEALDDLDEAEETMAKVIAAANVIDARSQELLALIAKLEAALHEALETDK